MRCRRSAQVWLSVLRRLGGRCTGGFSSVQFSSINGKTQHTPVQQAWPIAGPTSSMGVSYIRWATRTGPLGRCAAPLLPREAPLALMPPASPLRSVDARKSARPRGPCRRIPASRDAFTDPSLHPSPVPAVSSAAPVCSPPRVLVRRLLLRLSTPFGAPPGVPFHARHVARAGGVLP